MKPRKDMWCATPRDADILRLFGVGTRLGNVTFTRDQFRALQGVYGFSDEVDAGIVADAKTQHEEEEGKRRKEHEDRNKRAFLPTEFKPRDFNEAAIHDFVRAGSTRNLLRHVESDGLRVMAVLAPHVPDGGDPVRALLELLIEAGHECDWHGFDEFEDEG